MKTAYQRQILKLALLVGVIVFTELSPATLAYVPFLLYFILCSDIHNHYGSIVINYCWPLIFIFLMGGIISLASGSFDFETAKGAYYMSRPLIFMGAGIYLARAFSDFGLFRRAVIVSAAILSFIYIFKYLSDPGAMDASRLEIRGVVGVGYITVALGAALIIADITTWRIRVVEICALPVAAAATYLSGSRSAVVIIAIMIICRYANVFWTSLGAFWLAILLLFVTTPLIEIFVDSYALTNLLHSLPSSIVELIAVNRNTDFDVNNGWRGYETYRAFTFVSDQGIYRRYLEQDGILLFPFFGI